MNPSIFARLSLLALIALGLSACGTVESAARDDCTSIGWSIGSAGYEDCFRARVRERNHGLQSPIGFNAKTQSALSGLRYSLNLG
jgi:hypothetical protein